MKTHNPFENMDHEKVAAIALGLTGNFQKLMVEHDRTQRSIIVKTMENLHWSLPQDRIDSEYQEPQLDKQFGRAKKVYRRLMKLNNY